jgi:hypothetical protein
MIAATDGASVFAAGEGGVVRIGAVKLDVQQRYLPATAVDSLALTPDGRTLFALTATGSRIARLDAATGEIEGWVGDGGFDRLLGAAPY